MNILNTGMLGEILLKALSRKKNVQICYNAEVTNYDIDPVTKMVKFVKLKDGRIIPCDLVILSNGPEAPYHMAECLQTIFPSLQAQGYVFDI